MKDKERKKKKKTNGFKVKNKKLLGRAKLFQNLFKLYKNILSPDDEGKKYG